MKILHTADWHIGQFKGPVADGVNLRSLDTVKCLDYMVDVAKNEHPDMVCVSGDIFHQEQIGPVRYSDEMVTATRIIEELAEHSKFVIVMRGTPNHDGSGQFRVLEKMLSKNKKIAVVTTPQVISTPIADVACIPGFDKQEFRSKFPGLSAEEENLTWTKYISDMVLGLRAQCSDERTPGVMELQEITKTRDLYRLKKPTILMAHYTVPGCNMESGQTSFFSNFEPVIPREAIQAADYSAVLLGHIHRPQIIEGLKDVFYSGAINAMNFNDEGQSRGFWIHEFENGNLVKGHRYDTPYREFQTITWSQDEVDSYLREGKMFLMNKGYPSTVANKIVRIKYNCTSEQKKALNIPVLQSDLYDIGAFYVADIEAESMIEIANRGLLSEESDPLMNLKKWLSEKCVNDADKIVELGEPIISAAMKSETVSDNHGVLKPVSISVKNYRNYKEESFDFSDISFCSINGVNGAGKSSLFMDAIVDCLYEETREGDTKAWIRGSEEARSGSIEFVFDIGENRFRVVRTRTKSGRATLNISQKDGDEWLNLSAERIKDTQNEIEKILGMDSITFKSCALIMQDQYGLFLQAKKEDRMTILGNLLGLAIYGVMEQEAKKQLSDTKRNLTSAKEAVKVKTEFIAAKGDPEEEMADLNKQMDETVQIRTMTEQDIEVCKKWINAYADAKKQVDDIRKSSEKVRDDLGTTRTEKCSLTIDVEACDTFLQGAEEIRKKADEYRKASDIVSELFPMVTQYESEKSALSEKNQQLQRYENIINTTKSQNQQIKQQLAELTDTDTDEIERKIAELEEYRKELADVREKKDRCAAISLEVNQKYSEVTESVHKISTQLKLAESDLDAYKKQQAFIADSGCPDIEKATCRFLQKAREDVEKIAQVECDISTMKESIRIAKEDYAEYAEKKKKEMSDIGYSPERERIILETISSLEEYRKKKEEADKKRTLRARLEGEMQSNDKTISSCEENVVTVKLEAQKITETVLNLSETVKKYNEAKELMQQLHGYMDQETNIPVYEERRKHLLERRADLDEQERKYEEELKKLSEQMDKAIEEMEGIPAGKEEEIRELEAKKTRLDETISDMQIRKGVLLERIEDVKSTKEEITKMKKDIANCADLAARYEILKQAFSQDGVPHQIVRNIIPFITDTANNILGQMTGGTMGVEFVMERTVKGKDGDKATLDVLIDEYGKTTLPYASKSGGEKVKASLAVILALSEIKATAAGIQLGMLFIDEPPFLDDDGAQAYVDSLETIRSRYPDVKVMAITHDDAMKARFSQSITVIKTDDGSRVIC